MFERQRPARVLVAGAFSLGLLVAACGGGTPQPSGSSAGGSPDATAAEPGGATAAPTEAGPAEAVTLTFLVNSGETNEAQAKALVDAFTAANPTITIETSLRPGGGDGDNLVKTKLATGEMEDLFHYNSGSLLQALTPDKTLTNVADQEWVSKLDPNFKTAVGTANGTYGVPWNTSMAGGVLYNKDIYAELGLEDPDHLGRVHRQQREDQGLRARRRRSSRPTATPGPRSCGSSPTSTTSWRRTRTGPSSTPRTRSTTPSQPAFNGFGNLEAGRRSPGCSTRTSRPPPMTTPSRCLRPGPGPSTRC